MCININIHKSRYIFKRTKVDSLNFNYYFLGKIHRNCLKKNMKRKGKPTHI